MKRISTWLLGGRLLYVLLCVLVLVAALTGVLNALFISRVINDYLTNAQSDRVARDLDLANGFYRLKLQDITGIAERAAVDTVMIDNINAAANGNALALWNIDHLLVRKLTVPAVEGSHSVLVLGRNGDILLARTVLPDGEMLPSMSGGNWGRLTIIVDVMSSAQSLSGAEIIPADLLARIGLAQQAYVEILKTPQEAPEPFDPLEGTAGLALIGVSPLFDGSGEMVGAVASIHLLNNDFSFVDNLKNVGKIDTVTAFQGDLRVSTNVLNQNGERAVGTRVSQTVYDTVLVRGEEYLGRVFVVDSWYIGRYAPLFDHRSEVIGMLYVGVREAVFMDLLYAFNRTAALIALISIVVAGVIAIPLAGLITHPITSLAEANSRLAQGDMSVRVEPFGRGEIALLGRSFNNMAETLLTTERELLHKEKLASMGQLAAGVAHELNNPLSTILLYSEILRKDAPEGSPHLEDLEMITSEAKRCKTIVSDLLNFARQQEVLAQETNLNALIDVVVGKLDHRRNYEHVDIIREFDPGLPAIQADPAQLQQVFINLLNNAVDAMDGKGTLTITTRLLNADSVEVRVTDTGSGISLDNMDKLFTPFFTTKPAGKGTGLGLSIVYGIIKMHQGQIHIQSKVGEGTTFVITLPLQLPDGQLKRPGHQTDLIG